MISGLTRRVTSLGMWGGVCGLFSFFIASGNVFLGAAILCLILLYGLALSGPQVIASLWLIGSPTFFNVGNQVLKSLPFFTVERLMFVMLAGVIFLRAAFAKTRRPRFSRLEILIFVFLGYVLISLAMTATAVSWRRDLWFFTQYAMPMLLFGLSLRSAWSESGLKILLALLTLTGMAVAGMGVLQQFFGVTIFTQDYQVVTRGHIGRAHGAFTSAETYIATLSIFLVLTLFQFNLYRDKLVQSGLIVAMVAMLVGIVLGETRAPWGGAALALLIIFARDRKVRPLLVTGGAIALLVGVVLFFVMFEHLGSVVDRVTNTQTGEARLALWATAANMIAHNPVFGVGFGVDSFALHRTEYITSLGSVSDQNIGDLGVPHDQYLHVASLLGIVGLCLFVPILFGVLRLMFRIHKDPANSATHRRLALYVGAIWAGLMFNSVFSDTYIQDYFWVAAYFLAGLAAGLQREAEPGAVADGGAPRASTA